MFAKLVIFFAIIVVAMAAPQLYTGYGYNGYSAGYPAYGYGYSGYGSPVAYGGYGTYGASPYNYGYGYY